MITWLQKYGVALLMASVALHQLVRVQTQDLVSWRGGGFGMYASFHPRHHDAWVTRSESSEPTRYQKYEGPQDEIFHAVRTCLTWPSQDQADQAIAKLKPEIRDQITLEVYRLEFDPERSIVSRKLLTQAPRKGSE